MSRIFFKAKWVQKGCLGSFMEKVKGIINTGCNGWLKIGERFNLVNLVLEVILVFWHNMLYIPKGVLEKIKKSCFKFI